MFSSNDEFVQSLSQYFTKYIFESVGIDESNEIPIDDIKNAIKTATGSKGELLAMLCGGSDNFNQ
jgi:hypothetical protein